METVPVNDRYEDAREISLMAIDQYMREVHWAKRYSVEEEEFLLQRLRRAKEHPEHAWYVSLAHHASDRLVEMYQPVVISLVRECTRVAKRLTFLDLVQEGNVGLLKALRTYDFSREEFFSAYAKCLIRRALWDALREYDPLIRLTHRVIEDVKRLRAVRRHLQERDGESVSRSQVAGILGLSEQQVYQLESWEVAQHPASIEELLEDDHHRIVESDFQAVSPSGSSSTPVADAWIRLRERVYVALEQLSDRQREVIVLRYELDDQCVDDRTQTGVAKLLGVSRRAIGLREKRALEVLYHHLTSPEYESA